MQSIGRLSTLLTWLFSLTATAPVLADGGLLEAVSPATSKDLQRQELLFSGDDYGALFVIQNSQNGSHTVWDDGLPAAEPGSGSGPDLLAGCLSLSAMVRQTGRD
jgi:hypothetical protein